MTVSASAAAIKTLLEKRDMPRSLYGKTGIFCIRHRHTPRPYRNPDTDKRRASVAAPSRGLYVPSHAGNGLCEDHVAVVS